MKLLLDTHAFLWWILDDEQLSTRVRALIEDGSNEILISSASAWEIAIKCRIGKLSLPANPSVFVPEQLSINRFSTLAISVSHALHVHNLPNIHRDPFDRILVSQGQLEKMPILTHDSGINQYDVDTIW